MIATLYLIANGFTDVEPSYIRDWLIVLACFVGLAIAIMVLGEKIRGKQSARVTVDNDQLMVRSAEDIATRGEVKQWGDRLETDIAQLREELNEQRATARVAIGKLHHRIDDVARNTDTMKGTLSEMSGNIKLLLEQAVNGGGKKG